MAQMIDSQWVREVYLDDSWKESLNSDFYCLIDGTSIVPVPIVPK